MITRFGIFTIYKGLEMPIIEFYGHGLEQELEKNYRIISYPEQYGFFEGFKLDVDKKEYKKEVLIKDLDNAFLVLTKANYMGEIFEVEPYYGDDIHLHLATKDLELGKKLSFYALNDGYGQPYYLGEIKISEVDKVWEERSLSKYDLPLPNNIEEIKIIKGV